MFRALKKLIIFEDLELVFLVETKLLLVKLEGMKVKLRMRCCVGVDRLGLGGGLKLFWNEGVDVTLASFFLENIDAKVSFSQVKEFCFISFYRNPDASLRDHSWELFKRLKKFDDEVWIVCRNFNKIIGLEEMLGGSITNQRQMMKFRDFEFLWLIQNPL